jgi:hypothetical protein
MHAHPGAVRARLIPGLAVLCCIGPFALGCGGDDAPENAGGGILLKDSQNYRATAALSIPSVETVSGMDIDICWDDLVSDLQCHDVMPLVDINTVGIVRLLNVQEDEAEELLANGQLAMSQVDGYLQFNTDHQSTCGKLSSMSLVGTRINIGEHYSESSGHTYLLVFTESADPGGAAYAMTFVKPTSTSDNTMVNAVNGCGLLDFTADLTTPDKVPVPLERPWIMNWRDVTKDGQGYEIDVGGIDRALVGFYEGMTVAEVEEQILDLEIIATDIWEIRIEQGRTAQLEFAQNRDDESLFPGFDTSREGTWVFGLTCSTCQNPAPVVLSILDPGAPPR